jgi:hypothetical protein
MVLYTGYASPGNDIGEVAWSLNGLAAGETATPANFLRENAERTGMPPSRLGGNIEMTRHIVIGVKRGSKPLNTHDLH